MNLIRLLAMLVLALTFSNVGATAHACSHEGMGQAQAGASCPLDGMSHQGQAAAGKPCCNPAACDPAAHGAATGDTAAPHNPHGCCIDPAKNGHPPAAAAPSNGAWLDLGSPVPTVAAATPLPHWVARAAVFPTLRTPPPSSGVGSARLIC